MSGNVSGETSGGVSGDTSGEMAVSPCRGSHIVLIGPPGVGKGVQAGLLCARRRIPHLSTGDLLRDEIARGTSVGAKVEQLIDQGHFADDETIRGLIANCLDQPEFRRGFVMDGFPRSVRQAQIFDDLLRSRGQCEIRAISIQAPEDTILRRLGGRLVCRDCGRTYHAEFRPTRMPSVCDVCSGQVARRMDDFPDVQRERLRTYQRLTRPVVDYYRARGWLTEVDGSLDIPAVARQIETALERGEEPSASRSAVG